MTDVAAAVGIKQPSIYHFFTSREDLVLAAHREMYLRAVLDAVETYEKYLQSATTQEEFAKASVQGLQFAFAGDRSGVRAARIRLMAKALSNPALLREVNDAAFESNVRLASLLERAQQRGWIRDDVSALTLAVWIRSQVLGRFLVEVDSTRYDGDEWNRLALSGFAAALQSGTAAGNPAH